MNDCHGYVSIIKIKHNQKLIIDSLSCRGGMKRREGKRRKVLECMNTCMNLVHVRKMRLLHLR